MSNILVTGGYGFIGSNFCHLLNRLEPETKIFVLDKLTYASNKENLSNINHVFFQSDINNPEFINSVLINNKIDAVIHFAAETHVDNSIESPDVFINTNIIGTYELIKSCLKYQNEYNNEFKFIHISTDEVFGDLPLEQKDLKFNNNTAYNPSSPYSSSKAASDFLVYSFYRTYGFNAIITNCSNNYGKFQNKEKLIPKTIDACINKKNITVYGTGKNIRDWIHVEDHCYGIYLVLKNGKYGKKYLFGGETEMSVIEIVNLICNIFNEINPSYNYLNLIKFVEDRKGHDLRYAIDNKKVEDELNFTIKKDIKKELFEIIKNLFN